jgi:glycosyltransferase involved in cell wall biosynthesis
LPPVSIIIPAFNAEAFIGETIESIFRQSYSDWELIVVDDGSSDNTASIAGSADRGKLKLIRQLNSGVSAARNNGLLQAEGDFVVFFDADDLMSPDFLALRVQALLDHPEAGYVGGIVETFPTRGQIKKAVARDPENEILFFDPSSVTIPSNYMFRREVLAGNKIFFNKELSSTADRFFILEVSKVAQGIVINDEKGKLLYRHSGDSMSNKITPRLILDNEKFYYELKKKNLLPEKRKKFKSLYFMSLAKGFEMIKCRRKVLKYLLYSLLNSPGYFTGQVGKIIFKQNTPAAGTA